MESSFDVLTSADTFPGVGGTATFACPNCARRTEFEQPPCPDGHDSDCPEWYCTECGAATIVGRPSSRRRTRRARTASSARARGIGKAS